MDTNLLVSLSQGKTKFSEFFKNYKLKIIGMVNKKQFIWLLNNLRNYTIKKKIKDNRFYIFK